MCVLCMCTHLQPYRLILEFIQKSKGQRIAKPFLKMGDFVIQDRYKIY